MGAILEREIREGDILCQRMIELLHVSGKPDRTPAQVAACQAKRAKDRPLCPKCGQDEVRLNSSGKNKNGRYLRCYGCDHHWKESAKDES